MDTVSLRMPNGTNVVYKNPEGLYGVNRYQSQLLADTAWSQAQDIAAQSGRPFAELRATELCCGNGPAAVFLAAAGVKKVSAADINPRAVETTIMNASANYANVDALIQNTSATSCGYGRYDKFDLIVVNPPCGPTFVAKEQVLGTDMERAVDGGESGVNMFNHIVQEAPDMLTEKGRLAIVLTSTMDPVAAIKRLDQSFGGAWHHAAATPIAAPYQKLDSPQAVAIQDKVAKEDAPYLVWPDKDNNTLMRLSWIIVAHKSPDPSLTVESAARRLALDPYGWNPAIMPPAFLAARELYVSRIQKELPEFGR